MPQAERDTQGSSKENASSKILKASLDKLQRKTKENLKNKYGISQNFSEEVKTKEHALELCDKAMDTLANEYVNQLIAFKEESDPLKTMAALERAEVTWKSETTVINYFDADKGEAEFFQKLRLQTLGLYQDKLEESARQTAKNTTDENVALCLSLIGLMDAIYEEVGLPKNHPERVKFRDIARGFK